jgi:RNA-directed DNA polymerase
MNKQPEDKPPGVPPGDKQGGEATRPVAGAEPGVWSERMLAALERGMKGNRWFSLIDKVYADRTLELAWDKVRTNAGGSGVDCMTIERFAQSCPRGLLDLKEQLRQASYQPMPVKRVWIPKPGTTQKRPLGIPTVRSNCT